MHFDLSKISAVGIVESLSRIDAEGITSFNKDLMLKEVKILVNLLIEKLDLVNKKFLETKLLYEEFPEMEKVHKLQREEFPLYETALPYDKIAQLGLVCYLLESDSFFDAITASKKASLEEQIAVKLKELLENDNKDKDTELMGVILILRNLYQSLFGSSIHNAMALVFLGIDFFENDFDIDDTYSSIMLPIIEPKERAKISQQLEYEKFRYQKALLELVYASLVKASNKFKGAKVYEFTRP